MSVAPTAGPAPGRGYSWPPLPVLDPDKAAKILAERLGAAFDDLEAERLHVVTAAGLGRKDVVDVFLREFQSSIVDFLASVDGDVTQFITKHLSPRYQEAVTQAIGAPMTFTVPHRQALTALSTDTYADFLKRAQDAARVSSAFTKAVRAASAAEIPKIAAGGRTARQVADRLEKRLLTGYGITSVTYRDGSRVPVRVYAQMAARTKSGVAYNAGTLNGCQEAGVGWVEVFDGPECGWTSHRDPDMAARSIRSVADAGINALSHPNCRRSFGPRPDIATQAEANTAEPFATGQQLADMSAHQDRLAATAAPRVRAAAQRRNRLAVQRQARMLGTTDTNSVADIIREARGNAGLNRSDPTHNPVAFIDPNLTPDIVADMADGSASPHIVDFGDGRYGWAPERLALHNQIVHDALDGVPPRDNPRYNVLGGGPASGKSTMEKQVPEIGEGKERALVNADLIKDRLPEYGQITDGTAAAFTHEESSYVAKRMVTEGFARRVNVTLDGTGNGNPDDLRAKLQQAKDAGYSVNGYYISIDTDEAVLRSDKRAADLLARGEVGRVVPEKVIRGTHRKVSAALPQALGLFDSIAIYDNNVNIMLIARKLAGHPFEVLNPAAWEKFLRKANE